MQRVTMDGLSTDRSASTWYPSRAACRALAAALLMIGVVLFLVVMSVVAVM